MCVFVCVRLWVKFQCVCAKQLEVDVVHSPCPAQAFFVKDYVMNHPEDGDKITRLRELMFEQVSGGGGGRAPGGSL